MAEDTTAPSTPVDERLSRTQDVESPVPAYAAMAEAWHLPDALMEGTEAMRRGGETWLPKDAKERQDAYTERLNRSFCHPGYSSTIRRLASLPFTRPVTVQGLETADPRVAAIEEDADYQGSTLTQFARALFEDAANHGLAHILVDYPVDATGLSAAEERASGLHPYFCHIRAPDLIGWTAEKDPKTGRLRLLDVRIRETYTVRDGWKVEEVPAIRLVTAPVGGTKGMHVLFVRDTKTQKYAVREIRQHSFPALPLVTVYTRRTGYMQGVPPLADLADVNLQHYQSASDQRTILHHTRVPLLTGKGLTQEQIENGLVIGANRFVGSTSPDFGLAYVEHGGAAIGAGRQDLMDLRADMEALGMQPLLQRTGDATATAAAIDEARVHADVHAWVVSVADGLADAWRMAASVVDVALPEAFKVEVFSEFGLSLRAAQDVQNLIALWNSRAITAVTLLREVQRRGLLSAAVSPEDEAEAARDQQPPLALLGGGFGGGGGDEDAEREDVAEDEGREIVRGGEQGRGEAA